MSHLAYRGVSLEVASKQEVEAAYRRGVEDGIRQEGKRILEHIREGIVSWEAETDEEVRSMVQGSLECLAVCIAYRSVSKEEAIANALARLQPQPQPDAIVSESNS
jgi:hypothetical protein